MLLAPDEVEAEKGVIDGEERERDSPGIRLFERELQLAAAQEELARLQAAAAAHEGAFHDHIVAAEGEIAQLKRDVDAAAMSEAQQKTFNTRFYAWRDGLLKQCNDAVIPLALDAWQALNAKWLAFNADFRAP